MAANQKDTFDFIVTLPGSLAEKDGGATLRADQDRASPSTIAFADLGAFTVDALLDPSLYGTYPFVVPDK
jgi:hypothetical protein